MRNCNPDNPLDPLHDYEERDVYKLEINLEEFVGSKGGHGTAYAQKRTLKGGGHTLVNMCKTCGAVYISKIQEYYDAR